MSENEAAETELSTLSILKRPVIEIPDAASVQLQTLDLARHVARSPDGKHYVVATIDSTRIGQKYLIAVYPQQGNYLTLIRLPVCEFYAELPEDAMQRHCALVQTIQKGNLKKYLREHQ
jgi:hypothetical protein